MFQYLRSDHCKGEIGGLCTAKERHVISLPRYEDNVHCSTEHLPAERENRTNTNGITTHDVFTASKLL